VSPLVDPLPGVPVHLVVMGVSGCGKSTIARALHQRLGWEYAEGDAYHPQANIDKMASGRPLVDEDRWPWLQVLADWTAARDARGEPTVLACSSLRRSYRDLLRQGGAGTYFVHMHGDKGLLLERMESREHFMPSTLLESQLDTLELLGPDEHGVVVDIAHPVDRAVSLVTAQLDLARQ
jgi:gluconokinase